MDHCKIRQESFRFNFYLSFGSWEEKKVYEQYFDQ